MMETISLTDKEILQIRQSIGDESFIRLILGVSGAEKKGRLLFWQENLLEQLKIDTDLSFTVEQYINVFGELTETTPYPNYAESIDELELSNQRVIKWLKEKNPSSLLAGNSIQAIQNVYDTSGCHPDIIEHVWSMICELVPNVSKACIHGCPCAVNTENNQIVAVSMGMEYAIRVLPAFITEAKSIEKEVLSSAVNSRAIDLKEAFGSDWFFGEFEDREIDWM